MNDQWGVGDQDNAKAFDEVLCEGSRVELIFGEHPHSRSDNNIYARFPSGEIEPFDGHRVCTKVVIQEYNYLKESELSGDEIRKGGSAKIFFDDVQVYEFFHRDTTRALIECHHMIEKLASLPIRLPKESPKGKKIFYREVPAVIVRHIVDQGAVIIEPDAGCQFPKPVWEDSEWYPDEERIIKDDILSPHIWWFRD